MTTIDPGDVILVDFPFTAGPQRKRRPALVLFDCGDMDCSVARITTRPPRSTFDLMVADARSAGLAPGSVVRLHKLATLEKDLIVRKLGSLGAADLTEVKTRLRDLLKFWT